MVIVLTIGVLLFTVPAWYPILLGRPISTASLQPVLLLTLSSLLQVAFIVLVGRNILTLDYSLKFAIFGLPLCIFALITANLGKRAGDLPRGTVVCSILGLVMWVFLITVH